MKGFVAILAAGAVLVPGAFASSHRGLLRRHAHKSGPVGRRSYQDGKTPDGCAVYIKTVYELDGESIPEADATSGLEKGAYEITAESDPLKDLYDSSEADAVATPEESSGTEGKGPMFYETEHNNTNDREGEDNGKGNQDKGKDNNKGNGNGNSYGNSKGTGVDAPFPSGKIPCSQFPSDYGAIPIDWLGTGGWSGIQRCPSYTKGSLISYIETAVKGSAGCSSKSFCSYACPVGYEKTQWPSDQGATGQSIGGLYCNDAGMLELSRPEKQTLCAPGAGGVTLQNDLPSQVSCCRTDYPGTEAMVIPAVSQPGQSGVPLANPYSPDYYQWQGKQTTAQWYVNNKGLGPEKACVWDGDSSDHDSVGNWAPVNIGVGKNQDGLTFISIFPNKPTTKAILDFNIEIIGDVNAECKLENGAYTGGGDGCTTAIKDGQKAIVRFY